MCFHRFSIYEMSEQSYLSVYAFFFRTWNNLFRIVSYCTLPLTFGFSGVYLAVVHSCTALKFFDHLVFLSFGTPLSLPLLFPVHISPPASPSHTKPLAFRLAPFSDAKIYVTILSYPISLAILAQAPYKMEQAFLVPSVHSLLISRIAPLSKYLETGLPQIATPQISPSSFTQLIENLCPTVDLWCIWCYKHIRLLILTI